MDFFYLSFDIQIQFDHCRSIAPSEFLGIGVSVLHWDSSGLDCLTASHTIRLLGFLSYQLGLVRLLDGHSDDDWFDLLEYLWLYDLETTYRFSRPAPHLSTEFDPIFLLSDHSLRILFPMFLTTTLIFDTIVIDL